MYECFNPLTPKLYSFQTTFSIFMPTTHHIFISVQAAIISRLGGGSGGPSHQDDTLIRGALQLRWRTGSP